MMSGTSFSSGFELPVDRTAYLSDSSCTCCGSCFEDDFSDRKHCTFCYRGVCESCLSKQSVHHEKGPNTPICENCYEKQLTKGVNLLERLRSEIEELKEKFGHEKRATQNEAKLKMELEDELEKLVSSEKDKENSVLKEIYLLREANSKLEKEVLLLELEQKEKEVECKNLEQKIKNVQEEAESLKAKYHNTQSTESLKEALEKAREEYEKLKSEVENNESQIQSSKAEELELELKRDKLREELVKAEEKFAELTQNVRESENEELQQREKIQRLEEGISIYSRRESSSFINLNESKFAIEYNKLKQQIEERNQTIDKLKNEIQRYETNSTFSIES
jgi:chromosome segregation ATPase